VFRSKALRPVAGIVLVTFIALTLQPLTAAAQLPRAPARGQASSNSGEERFSRTLNEIHEILKEVVPQAAMPHMFRSAATTAGGKPGEKVLQAVGPKLRLETDRAKPLPGVDITAKVKTLRGKYKELKSLEVEVTKGFKETEKHIRDKNLPAEILARHEDAVAECERRKAEFTALMQAVEAAADVSTGSAAGLLRGALVSLGEFMAKYPNAKTHTPTDPNNLPWGSPKPVTRAPYTSPAQFKTSRLFGEPMKVAQTGSLSGISLPNAALPLTPTPADLAATEDVQITQAIKDLAASLNNQPVAIYNWVRNNILFVPSYGSIQGSDMTLQTMRGNSFDTASLLIALLRAANVPARYVYGTIEVPADKAMNWVGGVTVPEAAQNLMGQGGIPNAGVGFGGQIRSIRLEQVWVEAFVDYNPSRGAVNRKPNTWVPLDASFKQYQFTQGMDVKTNVPFDAQTFVDQVQRSVTLDEQGGWIRNSNQASINQTLNDYKNRVETYVRAQNPTATFDDILGKQSIVQTSSPVLLGTLPYTKVATGAKFQSIPANLRWKFRYAAYGSPEDEALESPSMEFSESAPNLVGKRMTLSFSPATQADRDTISSFMPIPHADGSPIDLSELPRSFPGYLIKLIPEIRVSGQVIASGTPIAMGQELIQGAAIFDPLSGWQATEDNHPIAGEYYGIGLSFMGVGRPQLDLMSASASSTKSRLEFGNLNGLTKDDIVGQMLHSAVMIYFAGVTNQAAFIRPANNVVGYFRTGYGHVGLTEQVQMFFGIPRGVSASSLRVDIDHMFEVAVAKDNSLQQARDYIRLIGHMDSGYEHLLPEVLFSVPSASTEGVSAIKALTAAAAAGQSIYRISSANAATVIPGPAVSAEVQDEISNAVHSGKIVTIHQSDVNIDGWVGVGYIIEDPDTGGGAYKIAGGFSGGVLKLLHQLRVGVYIAGLELGIVSALLNQFLPAGPWLMFTQFAIGLDTLAVACSNISSGALGSMIFWYTAITLVTTFLIFLLAPVIGPLGVLLLGQVLFYFNGWLMQNLRLSRGCMA
jgi:hypothetical protein